MAVLLVQLLDDLERLEVEFGSEIELSSAPYAEAMRACRGWGMSATIVALLHRARRRGIHCPVGMYAQAIGALDADGDLDAAMQIYTLGVEDGRLSHWHRGEPFSIDLHGFSVPCAACAVRYVLQHELGNYLPADLKIITGRGMHSEGGEGVIMPRIERLLRHELVPPVPYEKQERLECDSSGCRIIANEGCLVVSSHPHPPLPRRLQPCTHPRTQPRPRPHPHLHQVRVQDLFERLVASRPYETYCITVPSGAADELEGMNMSVVA